MSIRIMTAVWDSQRYDAGTLLVLLAMADYANDEERTCHPSASRLAARSRLSRRQVMRILERLKTDGVITPVGEHAVRNGSPIVIYRIETDVLAKCDIGVNKCDMVSHLPAEIVANVTLKCDMDVTPGVTPMSHDPLEEPSIEPLVEEEGAGAPPPPPTPEPAMMAGCESEPQPPAPTTPKNLVQQPPVAMYRDTFLRYPSKPQMVMLMAHDIADLRRWRTVLELWMGRGWSPTNISGMLDLYDHPERITERTAPPSAKPAAQRQPAYLHPDAATRSAPGWDEWLAELSKPAGAAD